MHFSNSGIVAAAAYASGAAASFNLGGWRIEPSMPWFKNSHLPSTSTTTVMATTSIPGAAAVVSSSSHNRHGHSARLVKARNPEQNPRAIVDATSPENALEDYLDALESKFHPFTSAAATSAGPVLTSKAPWWRWHTTTVAAASSSNTAASSSNVAALSSLAASSNTAVLSFAAQSLAAAASSSTAAQSSAAASSSAAPQSSVGAVSSSAVVQSFAAQSSAVSSLTLPPAQTSALPTGNSGLTTVLDALNSDISLLTKLPSEVESDLTSLIVGPPLPTGGPALSSNVDLLFGNITSIIDAISSELAEAENDILGGVTAAINTITSGLAAAATTSDSSTLAAALPSSILAVDSSSSLGAASSSSRAASSSSLAAASSSSSRAAASFSSVLSAASSFSLDAAPSLSLVGATSSSPTAAFSSSLAAASFSSLAGATSPSLAPASSSSLGAAPSSSLAAVTSSNLVAASYSSLAGASSSSVGTVSSTSLAAGSSSIVAATSSAQAVASSTIAAASSSAVSNATPSFEPQTIGDFNFVGCFSSTDSFSSFTLATQSVTNSLTSCTTQCLAINKKYAGIYGQYCYCADNLDLATTIPTFPSNCNIPCPGSADQTCGGNLVTSRFKRQLASGTLFTVYEDPNIDTISGSSSLAIGSSGFAAVSSIVTTASSSAAVSSGIADVSLTLAAASSSAAVSSSLNAASTTLAAASSSAATSSEVAAISSTLVAASSSATAASSAAISSEVAAISSTLAAASTTLAAVTSSNVAARTTSDVSSVNVIIGSEFSVVASEASAVVNEITSILGAVPTAVSLILGAVATDVSLILGGVPTKISPIFGAVPTEVSSIIGDFNSIIAAASSEIPIAVEVSSILATITSELGIVTSAAGSLPTEVSSLVGDLGSEPSQISSALSIGNPVVNSLINALSSNLAQFTDNSQTQAATTFTTLVSSVTSSSLSQQAVTTSASASTSIVTSSTSRITTTTTTVSTSVIVESTTDSVVSNVLAPSNAGVPVLQLSIAIRDIPSETPVIQVPVVTSEQQNTLDVSKESKAPFTSWSNPWDNRNNLGLAPSRQILANTAPMLASNDATNALQIKNEFTFYDSTTYKASGSGAEHVSQAREINSELPVEIQQAFNEGRINFYDSGASDFYYVRQCVEGPCRIIQIAKTCNCHISPQDGEIHYLSFSQTTRLHTSYYKFGTHLPTAKREVVGRSISLDEVAKHYGIDLPTLRAANPNGINTEINIPAQSHVSDGSESLINIAEKMNTAIEVLARYNTHLDAAFKSTLPKGTTVKLPPQILGVPFIHSVQLEGTLQNLSKTWNTTMDIMQKLNPGIQKIHPGLIVNVPVYLPVHGDVEFTENVPAKNAKFKQFWSAKFAASKTSPQLAVATIEVGPDRKPIVGLAPKKICGNQADKAQNLHKDLI